MATRTSVEAKITAIDNGGANTAAEVRDVLTELLNYTENLPPVQTVQSFRISSQAPFFGNVDTFKLFVSIRGIKDEFATMTLMYKSTNPESMSALFVIPFNQTAGDFTLANFNMLAGQNGNGIIPLMETGNYLMYPSLATGNLATTVNTNNNIINLALVRNYQNYSNSLIIEVRSSSPVTKFSTSLAMHAQKFTEDLFDIGGRDTSNLIAVRTSSARGAKKAATKPTTLEDFFGL